MFSRNPFPYVAALLFAFASTLSSKAASGAVATGAAVSLSAFADGTSPFTYQWYKNGVSLTGVTAATYRIGNFQPGDAGVYSTEISNSAGLIITENATLALASVPAITTQPINATVAAGGSVTFASTASGSPAPGLQWKLNGTSIAGATGASLTITNVQSVNAGTYTMVATNSAGAVTSAGAILTVNAATAPVITTQPASRTVSKGSAATFQVVASGSPTLSYQWKKNGSTIRNATGTTYTIASVGTSSAGTYTVVVSNSYGSITSTGAVLTIGAATSAPVFTTQPVSQTVTAGATVAFTVAASGSPTPTFQWKRNGTTISGATSSTLSLANAQSTNAGTYTAVATNSAGSVTSTGAVLTINPVASAPVITTQPVSQTGITGAAISFTITATGVPAPTYQWYKNGVAIGGATGTTYALASIAITDAAAYTVVVTNSAGSITSDGAILTVTAPATSIAIGPDFNRDGNSDLLWQNLVTGEWSVWLMAGTTATSGYIAGSATIDWQIRGTGDFNRDGQTDLLWQNSLTGEWRICLMTGSTVTNTLSLAVVSTNWELTGTGDFNGDGQSDILMQNTVTGECGLWLMNGTAVSQMLSLGSMPVGWRIGGCGDFNKNGQSDILWRSPATGEGRIWLMAGTTVSSTVSLGIISPLWEMCGCGDFNKDGQSDILWQNGTTGEVSVWLMNGTSMTSTVSLGTVLTQWTIRN